MTEQVNHPAAGLPIGREVDTTPARRPGRDTVLEGRQVRLVPLDPAAHADALFAQAHAGDAQKLWLYLGQDPFPDLASFRAHLDKAAAGADPFFLTILDRATGTPVGHATYMRIEPTQRVIEVGNILYTPAMQKTVGATEAMYLMARHAFEELGYRRYEWKCNALNAPSRRAAERYGFRYEGLFRQHMIVKGRSRDTAWFSMLDSEWPARRRAFEAWLDPANFDAAGRQRVGLGAFNARAIDGPAGEGLRRAEPTDLAAFAELQDGAYARNRDILGVEPLPLTVTHDSVLADYEVWLAQDGGGLAGALVLDPKPDHLLMWSVAAAPARQGQGTGTRLLAAAEARAKALGLSVLRLYTGEKLTGNVSWYQRHGYAIDEVEAMPDRRIVHMSKSLS